MIRALVFDVDGVVVRAGEFGRILATDHGLDHSRTADFFQGPFRECVLGRRDLRSELEPFLARWSLPLSVDEVLAMWFEADSARNEELLAVVSGLRSDGWPCYLASTQERYRAEHLMASIGLAERFDGSFFSCHLGVSKPDPAFYAHVADAVSCAPDSLLFFDDHPANVEGARTAGWNAELYSWGDDIQVMLERYDIPVSKR